ncbi:hypothetical protein DICVIV_08797 [Dictyocaulus viviparus]|uniref:Uncharacterized protein n=1 Tax=Dictyocaulus viviparus TaxID=29172 RepID=A0A0D8XKV5_DICVI|nr:hypothetical protein DICVIV_08797 [Dictyocaulus viviparus]
MNEAESPTITKSEKVGGFRDMQNESVSSYPQSLTAINSDLYHLKNDWVHFSVFFACYYSPVITLLPIFGTPNLFTWQSTLNCIILTDNLHRHHVLILRIHRIGRENLELTALEYRMRVTRENVPV